MSEKNNCWEYMKCGKGPDGNNTKESGSCPVALHVAANGLNGGINGGRLCWLIAETRCHGKVEHVNQRRNYPCFFCEFRYKVIAEEGLLPVCNTSGNFLGNFINQY
ncbi:MAG: hypothetical protein ISR97_00535 [Nitrospira sp.]|nr:hypothetical protein [Nitrospira sp.]